MNHKTDMQAELKRIASELRAYNPAADEYKGEHIHKVWAREIEAALASRSDAQADEIRAADPGEELQGWSVTVERNGVRLLTIEKDSVGGVENIGDFAPLVRDCAEHLLSFIGRDAQADKSGAATTPDAIRSLQRLEAACDQRAALLTPEAYLAAEKAPGMREALYELDMARREACEVLARAAAPQAEAAQGVAEGWVNVKTRLPEADMAVLAHNGRWTGVAAWVSGDYIEPIERWQDERREFIELMGPAVTHWMPIPIAPSPDREQVGEASGLSYQSRALLLNVLWHHQGGSSTVGQPIRTMLGIGQHDHLTGEQLSEAKRIEGMLAWHEAPDASPSRECGERQGAALSDDARECLMDVVSHHDNIVAGFAAQRLNACEAGDSDNAAYWTREINVAHRMKAQAERALAASAPTLGDDMQDYFNGNDDRLINSIKALLALDASGSLVPHGIGDHARALLSSAAARIAALHLARAGETLDMSIEAQLSDAKSDVSRLHNEKMNLLEKLYAAPQPQAAEPSEPSSSCDPGDICAGCRCKYNTYGKQKLDAVDVRVSKGE